MKPHEALLLFIVGMFCICAGYHYGYDAGTHDARRECITPTRPQPLTYP